MPPKAKTPRGGPGGTQNESSQSSNGSRVTTRDSNKRQKPMVESSVAPSERGTMPRKSNRNLPGFIVNDQNSVAWSDPYEPGETPFDFNGQPVRKQRKLANAPAKAGGRKKPHLPPPEENRQPVNTPNPTQSDGSPRTVVPSIRDTPGPDTQSVVAGALSPGASLEQGPSTTLLEQGAGRMSNAARRSAGQLNRVDGQLTRVEGQLNQVDEQLNRVENPFPAATPSRQQRVDKFLHDVEEQREFSPAGALENGFPGQDNADLVGVESRQSSLFRGNMTAPLDERIVPFSEHDDGSVANPQSSFNILDQTPRASTQVDPPPPKKNPDFQKYLDDGLVFVADLAWRRAHDRNDKITGEMKESTWRTTTVNILASMHEEVVKHLIEGNIALAYHNEEEPVHRLYTKSAWTEMREREAPCAYARVFCDRRTGLSPTPNDMRRVIGALRNYIGRDLAWADQALKIDNYHHGNRSRLKDITRGHHWYLRTEAGQRLPGRCEKVTQFCNALSERLDNLPTELDDHPLDHAFHYIGVSRVYTQRQEQHATTNGNSSWFMNLFLAVCRVVLENDHATWGFEDYVLCFFADRKEVAAGEILLTIISGASCLDGWGFEVHPAGINVHPTELNDKTVLEAEKIWDQCKLFRKTHTPFRDNSEAERRRIRIYPTKWENRVDDETGGLPGKRREILKIKQRSKKDRDDVRNAANNRLENSRLLLERLKSVMSPSGYERQLTELEETQGMLEDLNSDPESVDTLAPEVLETVEQGGGSAEADEREHRSTDSLYN